MEVSVAFHILHIKETKDPTSIKQAYYHLLKENNPEDDPEGFKRLREAYETANEYCREKEVAVEQHPKDSTPTGIWMEKLKEIYEDPKKRIVVSNWEQLFGQPICMDLDDGVILRDEMLKYLMDHYRLDAKVWKLIDNTFDIMMVKKQLKERFPIDFLDYITDQIRGEGMFKYEFFQLEDHADLDQYIGNYFNIWNQIRSEIWDGLDDKFEDLRSFGVYHPYEDVEKIKYLVHLQKYEEALAVARQLEDKSSNTDNNVMTGIALAYQSAGDIDSANDYWIKILANKYYNVVTVMGRANYLIEKEDYLAAKGVLADALDVWGEYEPAQDLIHNVNEYVISYYKKEIEDHPDEENYKIELGWCCLQEKKFEECIALLEQFQPSSKKAYSYYSLYGRTYYAQENFIKAIPYLKKWNEILLHTPAEEQDDGRVIRKRLGLSYYMLGVAYCKTQDISNGITQLEHAIEVEGEENNRISIKLYLASVYMEQKNYENVVGLCDEIILYNPRNYSAYLVRQEANYNLKHGQEVINDFYSMLQLYKNYYKPYCLAMKVFYNAKQWKDAKDLIELANKNQVKFSDEMTLYQWMIELDSLPYEKRQEQYPAYIDKYLSLIKNYDKETSDLKNLGRVYYEVAYIYWDEEELLKAKEVITNAIAEEDLSFYHILLGDILRGEGRYQEAAEEYIAWKEYYKNNTYYWFNLASCYEETDRTEEAINAYEIVYELDKTYREVRISIAELYRDQYMETYKQEYYHKSLKYINEQVEYEETWHTLNARGLIFMSLFCLKEAEADFKKALTYAAENNALHRNLGTCYTYMCDYPKAIDCYKHSEIILLNMGKGDYSRVFALLYGKMAWLYLCMKRYDLAIVYYKKEHEFDPRRYSIENILTAYELNFDYTSSLKMLGKSFDSSPTYEKIGDLYDFIYYSICTGDTYDLKQGMLWLKNLDRKQDGYALCEIGKFQETYAGDFEKAKRFLEQGIQMLGDQADKKYVYSLMVCYYMLGDTKNALIYAQKYLDYYGGEEGYQERLNYKPGCVWYYVRKAMLLLCQGKDQEAWNVMDAIDSMTLCEQCISGRCYDILLIKARYYEVHQQKDQALQYYQEAYQIHPIDDHARCGVYRLGGKIHKQRAYKKFLKLMKNRQDN